MDSDLPIFQIEPKVMHEETRVKIVEYVYYVNKWTFISKHLLFN